MLFNKFCGSFHFRELFRSKPCTTHRLAPLHCQFLIAAMIFLTKLIKMRLPPRIDLPLIFDDLLFGPILWTPRAANDLFVTHSYLHDEIPEQSGRTRVADGSPSVDCGCAS